MGWIEVDRDFFAAVRDTQVKQYEAWGISHEAAVVLTDENMRICYRIREDEIAREMQADRAEEFEDRSLGGQRHNLKMEIL